jgi:hypothetical protein
MSNPVTSTVANLPLVPVGELELVLGARLVDPNQIKPKKRGIKYRWRIEVLGKTYQKGKEWGTFKGLMRGISWEWMYCINSAKDYLSAVTNSTWYAGTYKRDVPPANSAIYNAVDAIMFPNRYEMAGVRQLIQQLVMQGDVVIWRRPENDPTSWTPVDPSTIDWVKVTA